MGITHILGYGTKKWAALVDLPCHFITSPSKHEKCKLQTFNFFQTINNTHWWFCYRCSRKGGGSLHKVSRRKWRKDFPYCQSALHQFQGRRSPCNAQHWYCQHCHLLYWYPVCSGDLHDSHDLPLQSLLSHLAVDTFLVQCTWQWDCGHWWRKAQPKSRWTGQQSSKKPTASSKQGNSADLTLTIYHQKSEQVTIFRLQKGHNHLIHHLFTKLKSDICPWEPGGRSQHNNLRHQFWPVETPEARKFFCKTGQSEVHSASGREPELPFEWLTGRQAYLLSHCVLYD